MLNTKEKYNEYLDSVDDVCMECALMSEEECERCPVRITVKQLEEYFEGKEAAKKMSTYTTIPIGVTRARGLCFNCHKITIFHKLDFNYFFDRCHLYANGYCEECGKLKCNLDIWTEDIVEVYGERRK